MTVLEFTALSAVVLPSIAAMVASVLSFFQGRKNGRRVQEVHEIVNSQRTAMVKEIKYLRDKVDTLETILTKGVEHATRIDPAAPAITN